MRKVFLLVCMLLVAGLATAQVMGSFNYSGNESRWGLTPGGVVMSPPTPYPTLMVTPAIALDNGMPQPVMSMPVLVMVAPGTPSPALSQAAAPRFLSLGAATFKTAYDLAGRRQDLAQVAAELKQNRPHATRTYTNNDIAALKPPKPLSH